MKIYYLDESTVNLNNDIDYSLFQGLGEFVAFSNTYVASEIAEKVGANECILVVNKVPITKSLISSLPGLKHVAVTATGYNNIDLEACSANGITVSNVPGYSTDSVAQHIFAMILNFATRIHHYDQDIKRGEWERSTNFTLLKYPTFELKGKTMGIIGFGAIGNEVARLATAFGMHVMINRKSNKPVEPYQMASLDEIYSQADVVSINCPLTAENKYLINKSVLQKMKTSALLINTARGPLVDQTDLALALNEGWIAGAGIDVLDIEPPIDSPLLGKVNNLILSPHSAWSTYQARQRLMNEVALNIKAFSKGEERNIVTIN